jgi:hypothetical protein
MTENAGVDAGVDPRVAAAEDAADPRADETDATMAAEDPTVRDDGEPDAYS